MAKFAGRMVVASLAAGLSMAGPQALGTASAGGGAESPETAATSGRNDQQPAGRSARSSARTPRVKSAVPRPAQSRDPSGGRALPAAAGRPSVPVRIPTRPAPRADRPVAIDPPVAASAPVTPRPSTLATPGVPQSANPVVPAASTASAPQPLVTDHALTAPIVRAARGLRTGVGRRAGGTAEPIAELVSGALLLLRRGLVPQSADPVAGVRAVAANPVADLLAGVKVWVDTYANLYPWWSGSLLPPMIRKVFFNAGPVAAPMQIALQLPGGETSAPIAFTATDADGNRLVYSVPASGQPGAPQRGTVVVDNATGSFTYTPDADFTGTDTFSFVVSDDTSPHTHAWENLLNGAFGILGTGLSGGHRDTATVTVFNDVDIRSDIAGDFTVLTYNISGMPVPFSGGPLPRFANTIQIGSRITDFDIVNVQQDVGYHQFLIAEADFPDRTAPSVPVWAWPAGAPFSDGLNSLSAYDLESINRQAWATRPNLLNPGGFTYTRQHIPGGSSIDVYNVDTSGGSLTNAEIEQLSAFIGANSVGRAVIVTGDFGQLYSDTGQTLSMFVTDNGLTDAWVQVEYGGVTPIDAPTCAYADNCEQPDKIFYRDAAPLDPGDPSTSPVRLQAFEYTNEGLNFRNEAGADLSASRPQSVSFGYSVDPVGPLNVDLANWIAELPALPTLPLTLLPFPGTHDPGSYGITPKSPWALTGKDQFGFLTELPGFLQDLIVKPIAAGWGKTQSKDLSEQFNDGIRYVDLRLTNEPDGQIYLEHGLRSVLFDEVVDDIAAFATAHPKEALVIYIQGIKNFSPETHAEVIAEMDAAFGSRMVPRALGTSATLAELWAIDKNVIVVYNNADVVAADEDLWPDATLYRPWPNVASMPALLAGNQTNLANRPPSAIWGMFGEPTPDVTSYVTGILTLGPRNIEQFMFNVHPPVQQWMRVNFKNQVNLVTADWYQKFWPAGSTFARDGIGAVYETLGPRLSNVSGAATTMLLDFVQHLTYHYRFGDLLDGV
ncbi:MAG: phosphatidylinositol-specific phospholipase C domain-containing protein, partial [Mycobacterium sp.]|nr:phosphatidylinositol-specific phospholipase C domain-containing protein [Mycobacterium sp.]